MDPNGRKASYSNYGKTTVDVLLQEQTLSPRTKMDGSKLSEHQRLHRMLVGLPG